MPGRSASISSAASALALTTAIVVGEAPTTAHAEGSYRNTSVTASASTTGKAVGVPPIDICSDQPTPLAPAPGVGATRNGNCSSTATRDNQTVNATASSSATLSASGGGGNDRFGRPLFSSITITQTLKANVEFVGNVHADPQLGGGAGSTAIVALEIVVETGTPYTVTVEPSGNIEVEAKMNNAVINGSVNRTTGGILDVRSKALVPDLTASGPATPIDGSVTVTVEFGAIPPIGACCKASCFVDTTVACADSGGSFRGSGTTCNPNPCVSGSASPTPTTTPTPSHVFTWINPAGGNYDTAANWNPPQVPTSTLQQDDTAVFDIDAPYGLNVAGARAKRFIIRRSSIDLVGGTAEVTSRVPTEPSLVVGQNGKLHLVSGTFTSVDSILGDVSGALAEVDLISGTPVWNNTGRLTIGDAGPGRLTVVSGQVTSGVSRIGGGLLGPGEAIVGGPGEWHAGDLGLGFGGGTATLEIRDNGLVTSTAASVGVTSDASVTLTSAGWTSGNLAVGRGGKGTVTIEDSAFILSDDAFIGFESTPGSSVTVDGTGAQFDTNWRVLGRLVVGAGPLQQPSDVVPDAVLNVVGSGHVAAQDLEISGKGDGKVAVDGVDDGHASLVEVSRVLVFGGDASNTGGQGTLSITDGAEVRTKDAKIGGFNFAILGVGTTYLTHRPEWATFSPCRRKSPGRKSCRARSRKRSPSFLTATSRWRSW